MRREMLRFLQKRKFRLVTRWKLALKDNIARVPAPQPFPFTLIFRTFDEVVHLLKLDAPGLAQHAGESFLGQITGTAVPTADHYMELFLSGRDVLLDFIAHDASFSALYPERDRQELRTACERVFRELIEREMREHTRRQQGAAIPG